MTSRDFAYWLQGYFEISKEKQLDEHQVDLIKRHLGMVFLHEIDPSYGGKEVQEQLNEIHSGKKKDFINEDKFSHNIKITDVNGQTVYRC